MENGKLVSMIIVAAIGIIMVGSILVPVIQDSIDGEHDSYSNGTSYMEYYTGDSVLEITASGVSMDNTALTSSAAGGVYVYGETILAYVNASTTVVMFSDQAITTVSGDDEYTITISDGTATLNDGTSDVGTTDCDGFYIVSSEATDTVVRAGTAGIYFNDLSDLRATLIPSAYSTYILKDGKLYNKDTDTAYTAVSGYAAVDGYDDLYLTSSNLTFTTSNGDILMSTPYLCSANVEGTIEGTAQDGTTASLMTTIPIFVILSFIMGFIALIRTRDA